MNFIEELPDFKILQVGEDEIVEGKRALEKFSDHKLTLVDGVGLAVMKREKIRRCWSTDRHLSLTGIPLVIARV